MPVIRGDGTVVNYSIRLRWRCGRLVTFARGQLPRGCPERHINHNGSLCLGRFSNAPKSHAEAEAWWKELRGHLTMQDWAVLTGRWPEKWAWAHGEEAARYQEQFESIAKLVPDKVVVAVVDRSAVCGEHLCPCRSSKLLKDCHQREVKELQRLWSLKEAAEERFWATWNSRPCCGTMRACRLRRGGVDV